MTTQSSASILVWNGLVAEGVPSRMDEGSKPVPTESRRQPPRLPSCLCPHTQAIRCRLKYAMRSASRPS